MPHRILKMVVLALVVAEGAVFSGCGLFKPRDPEPGGAVSDCLAPSGSAGPNNVVTNVVSHYASVAGLTCYSSMLDTSFAFHPDPADSIEALPGIFDNWNREDESNDASNIAGDASFHSVVLDSQYASPVLSSDQRTLTRFYAYHLIVRSSKPDTLYQGRADITFFQSANAEWHITTWIDRRDASGQRTWGYLRSLYRVGF